MIRKQIYIAPEHEAKLKRLAQSAGRSEAEIIREALEAIPEETDPIYNLLLKKGMILEQEITVTREESERIHQEYLAMIGNRDLGLTRTIIDARKQRF